MLVCLQDPSAMPRPTSQDLAGYWDMLQLSIEDVSMKFDELQQLKLNAWKIIESPEKQVSLPPRELLATAWSLLPPSREVLLHWDVRPGLRLVAGLNCHPCTCVQWWKGLHRRCSK